MDGVRGDGYIKKVIIIKLESFASDACARVRTAVDGVEGVMYHSYSSSRNNLSCSLLLRATEVVSGSMTE